MAKLWKKDYDVNKKIEEFTVGNDYLLDMKLLKWDVVGSMAHVAMLNKINIINNNEFKKIKTGLKKLLKNKNFKIKKSDEDVHTAVENHLTKELGSIGKKIHTARSRNDQVLLDTRLYSKDMILKVEEAVLNLCFSLEKFIVKNNVEMPGYTHTQKAMPSSTALWAGAFIESLIDDIKLLKAAYGLNDQSPLGSAAGYGVSINIDRNFTAKLLGFKKVQNNTLYCSNSRGKVESIILNALTHIMIDLGKIATDLIWFSTPEFGYFDLPKEICTGSSIMPQKKNPDVLEIVRAKVSVMQSYQFQVENIIKNQFSGYNRDYQLTKEPLVNGFELAISSINIIELVISKLKVNKEACENACSSEIYATDKALELVKQGIPFRDAYKEVGLNLEKLGKIKTKLKVKSSYPELKKLKQELEKEKNSFVITINKNFK